MKLKKHVLLSLLTGSLALYSASSGPVIAEAAPPNSVAEVVAQNANSYSLDFDAGKNYTEETLTLNGQAVKFRSYRNVVYVAHPNNVASQSMNIFIPAAYFENGTLNGYTKNTAPIFMPNGVGGYMPGKAEEPIENDRMNGGANAALVALSRGYVVAAPAIRGRTTIGDDGNTYAGKAPALIVDYKAAVRYLRYNQKNLPAGDTEKTMAPVPEEHCQLSWELQAMPKSMKPIWQKLEPQQQETISLLPATTALLPIWRMLTWPTNGYSTA